MFDVTVTVTAAYSCQLNTGWSSINKTVVPNKRMGTMCHLIWTTQRICVVFKYLFVPKTLDIPEPFFSMKTKEIYILQKNIIE